MKAQPGISSREPIGRVLICNQKECEVVDPFALGMKVDVVVGGSRSLENGGSTSMAINTRRPGRWEVHDGETGQAREERHLAATITYFCLSSSSGAEWQPCLMWRIAPLQ